MAESPIRSASGQVTEITRVVLVQTLAPKDGICIATLMSHRKLFARWMYLKLDLEGRDYMRHVQVLP